MSQFHPLRQSGFSLIELTIVLIVVALLAGGLLVSIGSQRDLAMARDTQQRLATIQESLLGFTVSRGRLPCPDMNGDGAEDFSTGTPIDNTPATGQSTVMQSCTGLDGGLPFRDLGVSPADAWDTRFRYRLATAAFGRNNTIYSGLGGTGTIVAILPDVTLTSTGGLTVATRGDDPATIGLVETKAELSLASQVAAVVISHGKNRMGGTTIDGVILPPAAPDTDELTNSTVGTKTFVRTPSAQVEGCSDTSEGSVACEFDDQVVWLAPPLIFNRMIAAGKLP